MQATQCSCIQGHIANRSIPCGVEQLGNYITIKASGPGVIVDGGGIRGGFRIWGHSHIIVDGFTINNASATDPQNYSGIRVYASDYSIIKNNMVNNTKPGGEDIFVNGSDNIIIEKNVATSYDADRSLRVGSCLNSIIRENTLGPSRYETSRISALSHNAVIEKNYFKADSHTTTMNLFFRDSENGIIKHNTFEHDNSLSIGALHIYDCLAPSCADEIGQNQNEGH